MRFLWTRQIPPPPTLGQTSQSNVNLAVRSVLIFWAPQIRPKARYTLVCLALLPNSLANLLSAYLVSSQKNRNAPLRLMSTCKRAVSYQVCARFHKAKILKRNAKKQGDASSLSIIIGGRWVWQREREYRHHLQCLNRHPPTPRCESNFAI